MKVSLKLLVSEKEIAAQINNIFLERMVEALPKVADRLKKSLKKHIYSRITLSEEYNSLLNGRLRGEFGLDNPKSRVDSIVQIWVDSLDIVVDTPKLVGSKIVGGISINAIKSDFSNVINLKSAVVNSKGGDVPWLRWLLLEGNKILVRDYRISFKLNSVQKLYSRSGMALMLEKDKATYRVPPEYAGTINDNWITNLFGDMDEVFEFLFNKYLGKLL